MSQQQLIRRFTPLNMLFLSVNGMIGSAWLFAPLYAAKIAGPSTIIAWILGGIATILIALTFAETATLIPIAGGSTRIPQISHGEFASFMMSWITWLSCVTMPPIEVQAVLQYSSAYFHSLTHVVNNTIVLTNTGFFWATIIMFTLCIVNIASFRALVGFNRLLFLFKVAVMVITAIVLMKTSFHINNFISVSASSTLNFKTILTAVATGGIAFAFTGFKHGVELAGETVNSKVAIPFAIVGSIIICLILYLALQIAFIGALDPNIIKNGWGNLRFVADAGPFVGIAGMLGIVWLVRLLYVDSVFSPLGAGLIYITSTSRIIYAMSKSDYLHENLSRVNKNNFPVWAIFVNFIVGMMLFLPLPGWQNMVSFLVSAIVISYTVGPVSLLCFRKSLANANRPFKLPFANLMCLVAFYCCNLMFYWTGWETISKLGIAISIGLLLFIISSIRKKRDIDQLGLKAAFWIIPYLIGLMTISYFGSFGGKNIITFGFDFLYIGIFSVIMLYVAVKAASNEIESEYKKHLEIKIVNTNIEPIDVFV